MPFRSFLPVRLPSRRTSLGLSLIALTSMLGTSGCLDHRLTGMYLEPSAGACVYPGYSAQFTAYGLFTEGGHSTVTKDISTQVHWAADLPQMATVSSNGLATSTGQLVGHTDITASTQGEFGVVKGSAVFTVSTACTSASGAVRTLKDMRILPGDQNLNEVGDTSQLVAVGHYSGAPLSADLTSKAIWSSSNPQVARVTPQGLVTATGAGDAVISVSETNKMGQVVTSTEKIHVGSNTAEQ